MTRKLSLLFTFLVVLAFMLAACGGDTTEDTNEPAAGTASAAEPAALARDGQQLRDNHFRPI